jgi:hypothetical protein
MSRINIVLFVCGLRVFHAARMENEELGTMLQPDEPAPAVNSPPIKYVLAPGVQEYISRQNKQDFEPERASILKKVGEDVVIRLPVKWPGYPSGYKGVAPSCTVPARLSKHVEPVLSAVADDQEAGGIENPEKKETPEAELARLVRDLVTPASASCTDPKYKPKLRMFTFAIGSIFNDESRRSSTLKSGIYKDSAGIGINMNKTDLTPVEDALRISRPSCPLLASIKRGFSRRWCYPSGPNWNIWAVSLHADEDATTPVLGGIVPSDEATFILMRPREENYDVLSISADQISLGQHATLRDKYPCDKVLVVAYGYKKPYPSILDVFEQEDRIRNHPEDAYALPASVTTESLCELLETELQQRTCVTSILSARGHVMAQSYIDVIISGILQKGFVKHLGTFQVWGGMDTNTVQEDWPSHVATAIDFVRTTLWPVNEVQSGHVLYINDRKCPRNPNPLYTPQKYLDPRHHGGTSSGGADASDTWTLIDKIMDGSVEGRGMLKGRMNHENLCDKLPVLDRWTDEVLKRQDSIWDAAYAHPGVGMQTCS